ncbi:pre-rRNA-processing protein TSR1 homolog [Uloborus diversus]|uniref:pre-rRNA-processing protein TSR1 homolog n=1 Tax=Uloborus diversus TaxID=327109 RepID=UPI00240A84FC|nr:pre-rRNA-processing protein TSR1 homolog [Uloborus diversus]
MGSVKNSQVVHRPGPFKQSNKPHKGGRSGKRHDKGKMDVKTISHKKKHDLSRKERKNRLNQLRKAKREEIMSKKRSLGGQDNPPILCMVLALDDTIDVEDFLYDLETCDEETTKYKNQYGLHNLSFHRRKHRYAFFTTKQHDLHSLMDGLKVADVLVLLHSASTNDSTEKLLSIIVAHALPTTVHVFRGFGKANSKKKTECRKAILKNIEIRFPGEKLHQADSQQELQQLLRLIGNQKQRAVGFRDQRFHLLAEEVRYEKDNSETGLGTLKVSGFVRGQPINVNGLVHIPGWGDFQLNQISYEHEPYPLIEIVRAKSSKLEEMALDNFVLCDKADPTQQESLQSEVVPDPMDGEQTWPTKEELDEVDLRPKKERKRVAEGTSEYQSAWIVDSEESDASEDEDDSESVDQSMSQASEEMDCEMDDVESIADVKDENYDKNMDLNEDKQTLVRFKEERMNQMFPDELDTPIDTPARQRFQKYRGLKNFNSSPWDPMENLPPDYARIYRFENFRQTKKKVLSSEKDGAMPGTFVTLHIKNVSEAIYDSAEDSRPFVIFGLLPHEQKMSVVNVMIRKYPTCRLPVKSKDTLMFHIGFRRFTCNPIFSEHKTGNKFKYERFLPQKTSVVASFYAPVTFPPASVVVFKQLQNGTHELVATGSVLNVDPNRIVVKRIVLSGNPFKIFKRTAVVRYMFFNKEDINWFKCIELTTKCGRRGHIRDSLGSHGHMKCVFDKQLQSQDVVLMHLYKRVFPKWTYDPYVASPYNELSTNEIEPML